MCLNAHCRVKMCPDLRCGFLTSSTTLQTLHSSYEQISSASRYVNILKYFLNIQVVTIQCWWGRSTSRDTASWGRLAGATSVQSGLAGTSRPAPSLLLRWWRVPGITRRPPSTRSNCWNQWVLGRDLILICCCCRVVKYLFAHSCPRPQLPPYIVVNKNKENLRANTRLSMGEYSNQRKKN